MEPPAWGVFVRSDARDLWPEGKMVLVSVRKTKIAAEVRAKRVGGVVRPMPQKEPSP